MKNLLLIFICSILIVSCTYDKTCKMDIEYCLHYPDTTITYKEHYDLILKYFDKDDYDKSNELTIKPNISSYKGSNYIHVDHSGSIGPSTTAPISINYYRVYSVKNKD